MLTLKQLQTFYWVGRLGTLSKAADKLHITQSAATKRLQEVEALAASPLFERGDGRKALLTPSGKDLLRECERLLGLIDALERFKQSSRQPARTLHLGLTDLSAMTWFPNFLLRAKEVYPNITIQPEINLSVPLLRKVEEGRLDFAVVPEPPATPRLDRIPVGEAAFGWFAAPGSFADGPHALRELGAKTVIEQSADSIITALCARLWEGSGQQPERIYGGNNVVALAGLVAAGVGVSCLPRVLFDKEVHAGRMQLVQTEPPAPSVVYYGTFLKYPYAALGYVIAELVRTSWRAALPAPDVESAATATGAPSGGRR